MTTVKRMPGRDTDWWRVAIIGAFVVLAGYVVWSRIDTEMAAEQADARASQAQHTAELVQAQHLEFADTVLGLCDREGESARKFRIACREAREVADQPPPVAPAFVPGPAGPDGPRGQPGARGRPGKDGEDGADGRPGKDGEDGADGRDGVDGQDGAAGRDGVDGKDGRDGNPAQKQTFNHQDGSVTTCIRDDGSPEDAPTYTCTTERTPGGLR